MLRKATVAFALAKSQGFNKYVKCRYYRLMRYSDHDSRVVTGAWGCGEFSNAHAVSYLIQVRKVVYKLEMIVTLTTDCRCGDRWGNSGLLCILKC